MKNNRYFRHDWGARNDPKMLRIVRVKGAAAKAVYWDLIEMLYEEGGILPIDAIEDVSFLNHLEDSEVARYVVFESGLFSYDDTHFWSERQQRDELKINEISAARKKAGKVGGEANAKQMLSKNEANEKQNGSNKINKINKIKENIELFVDSQAEPTPPTPQITPEEFKDLWNEGRGNCPKVAAMTDKRKAKAMTRIKEFGKTREEQREVIERILENIRQSDFLQNEWKCNFDWLIDSPGNWVKVIEGNYANNKGKSPKSAIGGLNINDKWNS